jgi:puromycin-sensitive aminopeptidase
MAPTGRLPLDDAGALVVVDPECHGFFRVRYDAALSARLTDHLMDLTPGQRYSLFDDLFDLVLAGHASVGEFVQLARSLRGETSPPVWSAVASGFMTLAHVAPDREARAMIGDLWYDIARPQLDELGIQRPGDESDQLVNEVRASLYSSLGSLSRDPAVLEHARAIFDGSGHTDNASIESAAIRVVGSTGSRADYDEMFRRFKSATSPQIERRYLFALPRFDDAGAIADLCTRALDGSIRSQDAAFVLGMGLSNRWHGESVWNFVTAEWSRISEAVPDNSMGRMLDGVQWLEHGDTHVGVHAFLAEHPLPQAKLAVAQHLERLDVHVSLRRRFDGEVAGISAA